MLFLESLDEPGPIGQRPEVAHHVILKYYGFVACLPSTQSTHFTFLINERSKIIILQFDPIIDKHAQLEMMTCHASILMC